MKRTLLFSLLSMIAMTSSAQFGSWSSFVDEQWDAMLEQNPPKASIEYTTGSEEPDLWIRFNEAGQRASGYNFKYDWNSEQNKLVSADTMNYDSNGNHIQSTYYEGTGSGPVAVAQWDAFYEDGLLVSEVKESYNYPNLCWEKQHSYDAQGNQIKSVKYVPNADTGEIEETINRTYDSNGRLTKEEIESSMFGFSSSRTIRYRYDAGGNLSEKYEEKDGVTEIIKYKYEDGRLTGLVTWFSYEGEDLQHQETAGLGYEGNRLTKIIVKGEANPDYYYHVTFEYGEDHELPIREITEFPGSSRTYTYDQSFSYYWW